MIYAWRTYVILAIYLITYCIYSPYIHITSDKSIITYNRLLSLIHLHELSLLTNQTVSNPRLTSWQLCHQFRKFIETWPLETSSTSAMWQSANYNKAIMHFQKLRLKSCHSDRQAKQSQRQQKRCANFPCQLMRNPTSDQPIAAQQQSVNRRKIESSEARKFTP